MDFLNGDPDQPIIIGLVYYSEAMPPYKLPASQTPSGLKSRSPKAGGMTDICMSRRDSNKTTIRLSSHEEDLLTWVLSPVSPGMPSQVRDGLQVTIPCQKFSHTRSRCYSLRTLRDLALPHFRGLSVCACRLSS